MAAPADDKAAAQLAELLRKGCFYVHHPDPASAEIRSALDRIGTYIYREINEALADKDKLAPALDKWDKVLREPLRPSDRAPVLRLAQRQFWEAARSHVIYELRRAEHREDAAKRLASLEQKLNTWLVPHKGSLLQDITAAREFLLKLPDYMVTFQPVLKYQGPHEKRKEFGHALRFFAKRDTVWWLEPVKGKDKKPTGQFDRSYDGAPPVEIEFTPELIPEFVKLSFFDYTEKEEDKKWKDAKTWQQKELLKSLPPDSLARFGLPFLNCAEIKLLSGVDESTSDYVLTLRIIKTEPAREAIPDLLREAVGK